MGRNGRLERRDRDHVARRSAASCSASSARCSRCRPRRSSRCCSKSCISPRKIRRELSGSSAGGSSLRAAGARPHVAARARSRPRRARRSRRLAAQHVDPRLGRGARAPPADRIDRLVGILERQHLSSRSARARAVGTPVRPGAADLPVYWLTGNIILCYNLLFISTFVLSAFGTYLLVRDLTGDRRAAFIAGLVYGFLPYRIASVPHLQVMSSQWMPFALYGLNRFVDDADRRRGARSAGPPRS